MNHIEIRRKRIWNIKHIYYCKITAVSLEKKIKVIYNILLFYTEYPMNIRYIINKSEIYNPTCVEYLSKYGIRI